MSIAVRRRASVRVSPGTHSRNASRPLRRIVSCRRRRRRWYRRRRSLRSRFGRMDGRPALLLTFTLCAPFSTSRALLRGARTTSEDRSGPIGRNDEAPALGRALGRRRCRIPPLSRQRRACNRRPESKQPYRRKQRPSPDRPETVGRPSPDRLRISRHSGQNGEGLPTLGARTTPLLASESAKLRESHPNGSVCQASETSA